jgi:NADH-quinone oxidoreductase subunit A
MLAGFGSILLFLVVSLSVSAVVVLIPFFVSKYITKTYRPYDEKTSQYECGFSPETKTQSKFNIKFYLVGVLFIIFDIEVAFLFPWGLALREIGWFGFFSGIIFLGVLTVGFVYEWMNGALDW